MTFNLSASLGIIFYFLKLADKKEKGGSRGKNGKGNGKIKNKSKKSILFLFLFLSPFFTRSFFLPYGARLLLPNLSLHSSSFDTSFSFAVLNCLPPDTLPAGGHRVERSLATPKSLEAGPSTSPEIVFAVLVRRTHYWNLLSRFNRGHAGCLCN